MGETGHKELAQAWLLFRHPIRPSEEEIIHIRSLMSPIARPRILVLGATPEMIDLSVQSGAERVVVVEIRSSYIPAMKTLAAGDWTSVEWVIADWRNHRPEFDSQFDIVIGHGALLYLEHPHEWSRVLVLGRDYLAGDGVQIQRTPLLPPERHDFRKTYEYHLSLFEASPHEPAKKRLDVFCTALCNMRQSAWMGAASPEGVVNRERYIANLTWMRQDLGKRFGGGYFWDVAGVRLAGPSSLPGYGELRPRAAPPWKLARQAFADSGLAARCEVIGDSPVPNCNCIITARKI